MTFPLGRRGLLAGAAGAAAALHLQGALAQQQELLINTYGGAWEKFWRDPLVPSFEKASGIKTTIDIGLGRTWIANLRAAGPAKPPYTALMMNEIWQAQVRPEGFFEPWPVDKVPNLKNVAPKARSDDYSMVFVMVSPIGIAYRTDLVKKKPTSWKDIWDNPEFKGKFGAYDIGNSAGVMFLMVAATLYGSGPFDWDAGFRQMEKLKPFPQVTLSGGLNQFITTGEIVVAPLDIAEVIRLKEKGAPVDFVVPQEGIFQFDQSMTLLKNGSQKEAAYKWLDYLLSAPVQEKLAEEFYVTPTNVNAKVPAKLKEAGLLGPDQLDKMTAFDFGRYVAERDKVVDRWNRTIK